VKQLYTLGTGLTLVLWIDLGHSCEDVIGTQYCRAVGNSGFKAGNTPFCKAVSRTLHSWTTFASNKDRTGTPVRD